MLNCVSCIYMLHTLSFIRDITWKYFLISDRLSFFLLSMVSFPVQKLLQSIRSYLFIFPFFPLRFKNIFLQFLSKGFYWFSSQIFTVFGITFQSLIHFDFICVYGIRECSNFILLHAVFSAPLIEVTQSVQSLIRVWLFATPWTAACQVSLSITNSRSLLKLMSIESVMPSNHLILCRPLLLPPSIFPSIRAFSNDSRDLASLETRDLQSFPSCCFPLFLCIDPWGRLSYLSLLFFGTLHSNGNIFPFLLCLLLLFFSQLSGRPPQTAILLFCISFSWGWSWSLSPIQCHKPLTIVLQAFCLSDLVP